VKAAATISCLVRGGGKGDWASLSVLNRSGFGYRPDDRASYLHSAAVKAGVLVEAKRHVVRPPGGAPRVPDTPRDLQL
jgi:hypothetical protein